MRNQKGVIGKASMASLNPLPSLPFLPQWDSTCLTHSPQQLSLSLFPMMFQLDVSHQHFEYIGLMTPSLSVNSCDTMSLSVNLNVFKFKFFGLALAALEKALRG